MPHIKWQVEILRQEMASSQAPPPYALVEAWYSCRLRAWKGSLALLLLGWVYSDNFNTFYT